MREGVERPLAPTRAPALDGPRRSPRPRGLHSRRRVPPGPATSGPALRAPGAERRRRALGLVDGASAARARALARAPLPRGRATTGPRTWSRRRSRRSHRTRDRVLRRRNAADDEEAASTSCDPGKQRGYCMRTRPSLAGARPWKKMASCCTVFAPSAQCQRSRSSEIGM